MAKQKKAVTPAQYKTKEFMALKEEWYDKLKEDGFKDIEEGPDGMYLKDHGIRTRIAVQSATATGKIEYYRAAAQFYFSHKFYGNHKFFDKYVWYHHSQGKTTQQIVDLIAKNKADKDWPMRHTACKNSVLRTKAKMIAEANAAHDELAAAEEELK